jgi:AhpC/TSA family
MVLFLVAFVAMLPLEDGTMRRTRMALLMGLLLLPALSAADKPAPPSQKLEAIKKEFETARTKLSQADDNAKTDQERQQLRNEYNKQIKAYARSALELAQKYPKDPAAVDALSWIIGGGLGWLGAGTEIETAFDVLQKDYIASDKLQRVCDIASVYDSVSTKPEPFLRAVLKNNPHRAIQGHACYGLMKILRGEADWAKMLREPEYAKAMENGINGEVLKHLKASDPDKLLSEVEELLERLIVKYSDVKGSRRTLGEIAKATLFEMRYLVVGKVAPEIEGEDLDGKRFKLSDYRGKVVVLDFWGHW